MVSEHGVSVFVFPFINQEAYLT